MRIVGGEARGRTLLTVPGNSTRPTADRVRQSLFDLLGQRFDGLRVLDLYAGSGALALEALSRGALHATLVEEDARACSVIERNIAALRYQERCTLLHEEVGHAIGKQLGTPGLPHRGPFDLLFSDPPYALRAAQVTLDALALHGLLAPFGRAVIERDKREPRPTLPPGFSLYDDRAYGDTAVLVVTRSD